MADSQDALRARLARLALGTGAGEGAAGAGAVEGPGVVGLASGDEVGGAGNLVPSPPSAATTPERLGSGAGAEIRQRAAASAFSAYTAANGHPLTAAELESSGSRWLTRPRVVVAGLAALALVVAVVAIRSGNAATTVVSVAGSGDFDTTPEVVVHVVGEVNNPGLVRLPTGSRAADAIEAAGGATPAADLSAVNLARPVVDGEQLLVPLPGAAAPLDPRLDLNSVDAAGLEGLPGIGPVLAQRIVDWREAHGRFTSVDELGEVSGIGPAVLAQVRELVRVG